MVFNAIGAIRFLFTVEVFNETQADWTIRNVTRNIHGNNFRIRVTNTDAVDNYIENMWNRLQQQ